jgi:hypothetical protein
VPSSGIVTADSASSSKRRLELVVAAVDLVYETGPPDVVPDGRGAAETAGSSRYSR